MYERLARRPVLTVPFALLTVGHFLQALGYASMILLPLYLTQLGASRSEVGFYMALAYLGGLVTRPAVGGLLDRWGRKNTLLLGTVVLSISVAAVGFVTQLGWLLALARLGVGAGVGVLFTGYFTFVADIVPEERRTEGLALFGISGLAPLALNALVGRIGIEAPELAMLFPVVGALIAGSIFALLPLREPPTDPSVPAIGLRDTLVALRARPLWPVWWATLTFGGLVYTFMSFATVMGADRGLLDPAGMWATYALGAVGVRLFGAQLPDRVGPSRILVPAMGSYIAAYALCAASSTGTPFLVAGLLAGLGHGYCFPVLAGQAFTRSPPPLRGSAMAAFTALWDVAALTLVPLAGLLADRTSDSVLFDTVAVVALASLTVWAVMERRLGVPVRPV